MTAVLPTSSHEIPVFFPAGEETLFGIFTSPTIKAIGTAVIFLPGGGQLPSPGRNRFTVRFCRRLALEGYHAMRFDYNGVGESTGIFKHVRLDQPCVDDLEGAVRWIRAQGVAKFVLVGSCFGARTALAWAHGVVGVQGIVLLSAPVRDPAPRSAAEWSAGEYTQPGARLQPLHRPFAVNPTVLGALADLVKRRVPVLFVYGTAEGYYEDFQRAASGRLGSILERGDSLVEVATLPGRVHALPRIDVQDTVIELINDWLHRPSASAGVGS